MKNKTFKSKTKKDMGYVLEPRVMLDAAAVATGVEAVSEAEARDAAVEVLSQGIISEQVESIEGLLQTVSESQVETGVAVVIIDGNVEDYQTLVNGLNAGTEVVVLNDMEDGLTQIANAVANISNISSLHVVSHGDAGMLSLGESQVNFAALNSAQQSALEAIGGNLLAGADILVYGCDFGGGERGKTAVETFGRLTGADIAASDDTTGSVVLGADWNLEVASGLIESEIVFNQASQSSFATTLAEAAYINKDNNATYSAGTTVAGSDKWIKKDSVTEASNTFVDTKGAVKFVRDSSGTTNFAVEFNVVDDNNGDAANTSSEIIIGFTKKSITQPGTSNYDAGTTSVEFGVYYDSGIAYAFVSGDLNDMVVLGDDETDYKIEVDAETGAVKFYAGGVEELDSTIDFSESYTVANGDYVLDMDLRGAGDGFDNIVMTNGLAENTAPVITSNGGGNSAVITVAENTTEVTTIVAADTDVTAPNNTLTYSIVSGVNSSLFSVDSVTGELTFNSAPDFEAPGSNDGTNTYDVYVKVADGGNLFDTQYIVITVTDVNEAVSISSNGGGATAAIVVLSGTKTVTTVESTDIDSTAPNNTASYSITGGANQALFAINATTGELTFITAPDRGGNVYDVTVAVTDGGSPSTTDSQDLTITVSDILRPNGVNGTTNSTFTSNQSKGMDFGDINNDGFNDIVVAEGDGHVAIFLNDGHGAFNRDVNNSFTYTVNADTAHSAKFKDVSVTDLNKDGDLDIVGITYGGHNTKASIVIGINDGSGNFKWMDFRFDYTGSDYVEKVNSVVVGNFDGNGDSSLDIAITDGKRNNLVIFSDVMTGANGSEAVVLAGVTGSTTKVVDVVSYTTNVSIISTTDKPYVLEVIEGNGADAQDHILVGTRDTAGGKGRVFIADSTKIVGSDWVNNTGGSVVDLEVVQDETGYGYVAALSKETNDNRIYVWKINSFTGGVPDIELYSNGNGATDYIATTMSKPRAVGFVNIDGDDDLDLIVAGRDLVKPLTYLNGSAEGQSAFDVSSEEKFVGNATKAADIISANILGTTQGTISEEGSNESTTSGGVFFSQSGGSEVSFVRTVFDDTKFYDTYHKSGDGVSLNSVDTVQGSYTGGALHIHMSGIESGDRFEFNGEAAITDLSVNGSASFGAYSYFITDGYLMIVKGSDPLEKADFVDLFKGITFVTTGVTGNRTFTFTDKGTYMSETVIHVKK